MELAEVKDLLEKYLEANTTLEEERQLEAYFASGNVHPEVASYGDLFGYFASQKTIEAPAPKMKSKSRLWSRWIPASAAAVILMAIGTFAWKSQEIQPEPSDLGTFDDPEIAYQETVKALELLSGKVNTGMNSVAYLNEYEQSKNTIFKN